jgi:hypothetical protein
MLREIAAAAAKVADPTLSADKKDQELFQSLSHAYRVLLTANKVSFTFFAVQYLNDD